jgi:hypothetical protein
VAPFLRQSASGIRVGEQHSQIPKQFLSDPRFLKPATFLDRRLAQIAEVALVIVIIQKTRIAVVAALDDMLRGVWEVNARLAGQGSSPFAWRRSSSECISGYCTPTPIDLV